MSSEYLREEAGRIGRAAARYALAPRVDCADTITNDQRAYDRAREAWRLALAADEIDRLRSQLAEMLWWFNQTRRGCAWLEATGSRIPTNEERLACSKARDCDDCSAFLASIMAEEFLDGK